MQISWNLYRFDYERYKKIKFALRSASDPNDFLDLLPDPEGEAIAMAVQGERMAVEIARNAILQRLCCTSDPLPLDSGFPRFFVRLARLRDGEDAAELLERLMSGRGNVEDWWADQTGLIGWLTPEETKVLLVACTALSGKKTASSLHGSHNRGRQRSSTVVTRSRRSGKGFWGRFFRNLLLAKPTHEDLVLLLETYLRSTVAAGHGLAILPG